MKKFTVLAMFIMVTALSACGDSGAEDIGMVKNGSLQDCPKYSIETVINVLHRERSSVPEAQWTSKDGIVTASIVSPESGIPAASFVFVVKDGSFFLNQMTVRGVPQPNTAYRQLCQLTHVQMSSK